MKRLSSVLVCVCVMYLVHPFSAQGAAPAGKMPGAAIDVSKGESGGVDTEKLAMQTQNPVAMLISVPFQNNWDFREGELNKTSYLLNFQPVVPVPLNKDWNLISRTILPVASEPALIRGMKRQSGLGDLEETLFFSPAATTATKLIWGAGPIVLVPTATDTELGNGKFGMGPSVVALNQTGPWTVGVLWNQILTVSGSGSRRDTDRMLLQPFVAYLFPHSITLTLDSETTADWSAAAGRCWEVPFNLILSKVTVIGKQPMSFAAGVRYYAHSPVDGPNWGVRAVCTLLFPEGAPKKGPQKKPAETAIQVEDTKKFIK